CNRAIVGWYLSQRPATERPASGQYVAAARRLGNETLDRARSVTGKLSSRNAGRVLRRRGTTRNATRKPVRSLPETGGLGVHLHLDCAWLADGDHRPNARS
ncbi:MAG: hypothetical protein ACM3ML_01760, partial [Micromonosporaceae bacterium]